ELPSLNEEFYNRSTWQIAYGSMLEQRRELREMGKTEEDIYRLAIENVQKFAVVGTQEDMPEFAKKIKAKYGSDLNVEKINVTQSRAEAFDLPIRTVRRIQQWVEIDLELFEFVRHLK